MFAFGNMKPKNAICYMVLKTLNQYILGWNVSRFCTVEEPNWLLDMYILQHCHGIY